MAQAQIGLAKHNLDCMSTDGCNGGFAMNQREIFLDAHLKTALDRIEQEAVLREAGIENLETCPFCPFAMVSCSSPGSNGFNRSLRVDPTTSGIPNYRGGQRVPLLEAGLWGRELSSMPQRNPCSKNL